MGDSRFHLERYYSRDSGRRLTSVVRRQVRITIERQDVALNRGPEVSYGPVFRCGQPHETGVRLPVVHWRIGQACGVGGKPAGRIFPYLLRRSDGLGGGDIPNRQRAIFAGRWSGDSVELVGDYDSDGGYGKAFSEYTNISPALAADYNEFIACEDSRLAVAHCSTCTSRGVEFLNTSTPSEVAV